MSEQTEHEALFDFLSRIEGRHPDVRWAFHCPNEADGGGTKRRVSYTRRDGSQGWKMVPLETLRAPARGIRPGIPDVLMPIVNAAPIGGEFFVGLAIELKHGRNTTTDDQAAWLECLQLNGWATYVCYHWTDAARIIIRWVGGDPEEVQGL